jgi:hypothetical protein
MFRSSLALAGRASLFCIISQHFVLATFTKSLRDESSAHTLSLKLRLMGRSPGFLESRLRRSRRYRRFVGQAGTLLVGLRHR